MRLKPIRDTFKAYKYASSQIIIPSRNKAFKYVPGRFSEKGTNSSKRKPKYPTNWRDVSFIYFIKKKHYNYLLVQF